MPKPKGEGVILNSKNMETITIKRATEDISYKIIAFKETSAGLLVVFKDSLYYTVALTKNGCISLSKGSFCLDAAIEIFNDTAKYINKSF